MKTCCILLFFALICISCINPNRYSQIESCPDLPAFVVDLSAPAFFNEAWFWLNNTDQQLVHEESLIGSGAGTLFVNYKDACEERYTISIGTYNELVSSAGGVIKEVNIEEVSDVPSGLGLAIFPRRTFLSVTSFNDESALTILHCPPIDSVRYAQSIYPIENAAPPINFSYHAEDSMLMVFPGLPFSRATEEVLAIRLAGTDDWRGKIVPIPTLPNSQFNFNALDTFTLHTLAFPETETKADIIIKLITSLNSNTTTELARNFGNSITFPAPAAADGILLCINTEGYEAQSFHTDYPTNLQLSSSLSIDELRLVDDQFEIQTSGGDVIRLISNFRDTAPYISGKRVYTLEAGEGLQTVRLPVTSRLYLRADESIALASQSSYQFGGALELIHYPTLNGDYNAYLRTIISIASNSNWLSSQQYEKLSLEF